MVKTARRVTTTVLVVAVLAAAGVLGVHWWLTDTTDRVVDAVTPDIPSISVEPALDRGRAELDKLRHQVEKTVGGWQP